MTALAILCNLPLTLLALQAFLAERWGVGGALHLAAAATGLAAVRHQTPRPGSFEIALALTVPGLGGALVWLFALLTRRARGHEALDNFLAYIDPAERLGGGGAEIRHRFTPKADRLAPLSDILHSNAPLPEKRLAIEGLARVESPAAIETLREMLSCDSVEIRFYAASILAQLEERLALRLSLLEKDVLMGYRLDPEVERELAQTYLDYAYYGLVEGTRRTTYLERALTHAEAALERGAQIPAALIAGRALLELERPAEAEGFFARYLEANPMDQRGLLWRAEARFNQGRYHDVHHDCQEALQLGGIPENMQPAIGMWA